MIKISNITPSIWFNLKVGDRILLIKPISNIDKYTEGLISDINNRGFNIKKGKINVEFSWKSPISEAVYRKNISIYSDELHFFCLIAKHDPNLICKKNK